MNQTVGVDNDDLITVQYYIQYSFIDNIAAEEPDSECTCSLINYYGE